MPYVLWNAHCSNGLVDWMGLHPLHSVLPQIDADLQPVSCIDHELLGTPASHPVNKVCLISLSIKVDRALFSPSGGPIPVGFRINTKPDIVVACEGELNLKVLFSLERSIR